MTKADDIKSSIDWLASLYCPGEHPHYLQARDLVATLLWEYFDLLPKVHEYRLVVVIEGESFWSKTVEAETANDAARKLNVNVCRFDYYRVRLEMLNDSGDWVVV